MEEISGDESPVMVCFEPLKVETISDNDMDLNDEDMHGDVFGQRKCSG